MAGPVNHDPYLLDTMERAQQKEASPNPPAAQSDFNASVAGTVVEDSAFQVLWTNYVAKSKNPSYYNDSHKAVAHLGWVWAIAAFRKFGNRIT